MLLRSHPRGGVLPRHQQRGLSLLMAMLALAILSSFLSFAQPIIRDRMVQSDGEREGGVATFYAAALNTYLQEFSGNLQNAAPLPITKNGYTVAAANVMNPTIADLNGLGYLSNTTAAASYTLGTYTTALRRTPAGCVLTDCDLVGLLYIDTPVRRNAAGDLNGIWISGFLSGAKANGGYSTLGTPAQIRGAGWFDANPVVIAGAPAAGIVAVRVGFGASGLGIFARLDENRPVTFRNTFAAGTTTFSATVSATGNISTQGDSNAVGAVNAGQGAGAGGCALATLGANGTISSRDPSCVTRVALANDGSISSSNAAGVVSAGVRYAAGQSQLFADNLFNNAGNAGIRSDGTVFGVNGTFSGNVAANSVVINGVAAPGTACTIPNQVMTGLVGAQQVLMICSAGIWQLAGGSSLGVTGGFCPVNGSTGIDATGVSLFCSGNAWTTVANRIGRWAMSDAVRVVNGSVVVKPVCPIGSVPLVFDRPQNIDATGLYVSFTATDNGASWTINIVNGTGVGTASSALAESGCWFF